MAKKYVIRKPDGEIIGEEEKKSKKKEKAAARICRECSHITPSDKYLSVAEKKPLLGSCPHMRHLRLLSENACQHFEEIENN